MLSNTPERILSRSRAAIFVAWLSYIGFLLTDFTKTVAIEPSTGVAFFWSLVGGIPLILLVFGHEAWRRICPLSFATMLPRRLWQVVGFDPQKLPTRIVSESSWLGRNHVFLQFFLLATCVCTRFTLVGQDPVLLALLLMTILAAAMTTGIVFGGKTWCNYICPVSPAQKVFTASGGLLESSAHTHSKPLKKSMCRVATPTGDVSNCVSCKKFCPDVDLEAFHWFDHKGLKRQVTFYGYLGMLWAVRFYLQAPRNIHPSLWFVIFAISVAIAIAAGAMIERIWQRVTRASPEVVSHHAALLAGWAAFIAFYELMVLPKLTRLLPDISTFPLHVSVIALASLWLAKGWRRSRDLYEVEKQAESLNQSLFRAGSVLDSLKRHLPCLQEPSSLEVYTLGKVLPAYEKVLKGEAYSQISQTLIADKALNKSVKKNLLTNFKTILFVDEAQDDAIFFGDQVKKDWLDAKERPSDLKAKTFIKSLQRIIDSRLKEGVGLERTINDGSVWHHIHHLEQSYVLTGNDLRYLYSSIVQVQQASLASAYALLRELCIKARLGQRLGRDCPAVTANVQNILHAELEQNVGQILSDLIDAMSDVGEDDALDVMIDVILEHARPQLQGLFDQPSGDDNRTRNFALNPKILIRLSQQLLRTGVVPDSNELAAKVSSEIAALPEDRTTILRILANDNKASTSILALHLLAQEHFDLAAETAIDLIQSGEPHPLVRNFSQTLLSLQRRRLRGFAKSTTASDDLDDQNVNIVKNVVVLKRFPAFKTIPFERAISFAENVLWIRLAADQLVTWTEEVEHLALVVEGSCTLSITSEPGQQPEQRTHRQGDVFFLPASKGAASTTKILLRPIGAAVVASLDIAEFEQGDDFYGAHWISTVKTLLERLYLPFEHLTAGTKVAIIRNPEEHLDHAVEATIVEVSRRGMRVGLDTKNLGPGELAARDLPLVSGFDPSQVIRVIFKTQNDARRYEFKSRITAAAEGTITIDPPKQVVRYERRDAARALVITVCEVTYSLSATSDTSLWLTTIDIGSGGLRLAIDPQQLNPRLKAGKHVNLRLYLNNEVHSAVGEILEVMDRATGSCLRVAFIDDNPARTATLERSVLAILNANVKGTSEVAERDPHSWQGALPFHLVRKERECEGVYSFYFAPTRKMTLPAFKPGQFVTVGAKVNGVDLVFRCYSLSDTPNQEYFRVTIKKKVDLGTGAPGIFSTFMHEQLHVGETVLLMAPSGDFFLDVKASTHLVLIAGGVGITPVFTMAKYCAEQGSDRRVTLFYGVGNSSDHIYKDALRDLAATHPNIQICTFYARKLATDVQGVDYDCEGVISLEELQERVPRVGSNFYMCGSEPMLLGISATLQKWGVSPQRIHYELFTPSMDPVGGGIVGNGNVTFLGKPGSVPWKPDDRSLLDLALANDVAIPFACRRGSCGTCKAFLLEGKVQTLVNGAPTVVSGGNMIQACCSVPLSDCSIAKL